MNTETADPASTYHEIREQLSERVVGHEQAIARLSLLGMRHVHGATGQRLTLIGPSGVGKTTLVRALADVLGAPRMMIEVGNLAETNWKGRSVRNHLTSLHRCCVEEGRLDEMGRSVVFLDEIDKLQALEDESGSARSYHRGKQQSLLALLGGDQALHYSPSGGEPFDHSWSSEHALVIAAGVFDGLDANPPTPSALVRFGLISELVERMGMLVRLSPLGPEHLTEVLRRETSGLAETFRSCGYRLQLEPSALEAVARRVADPEREAGPRSGATWLEEAAMDGLTRLLEEKAPSGRVFRLTADELELPSPTTGHRIGFSR